MSNTWCCTGRAARSSVLLLSLGLTTLPTGIGVSAADDERLEIRRSSVTGLAAFVTAVGGGTIPLEARAGEQHSRPIDFLEAYGYLFDISDPQEQLEQEKVTICRLQQTHTTYQQVHQGVPVFTGVLKVHQDALGQVIAANGDFYPIPSRLNVTATTDPDEAGGIAGTHVLAAGPMIQSVELVIVDPAWYGDPPQGCRLAYHVVVTDVDEVNAWALLIDAHTGILLDKWSLIHTIKYREIYDAGESADLPGTLVRVEDGPSTGDYDADAAYDYSGDVYDYYWRAFAHDGLDGAGLPMTATVHSTAVGCPNAFWKISLHETVYCSGTIFDDVVGHEFAHGLVFVTANILYQNQGGQLHESYGDVFGELVDLFNGDVAFAGPPDHGIPWPEHETDPGLDEPNNLRLDCTYPPDYPDGVRWLIAEGVPALGGIVRDMYYPTCTGNPDHADSPLLRCSISDAGGGHGGCGVPNHAFAMLTDGKTFNGFTVNGIGPIKSGAVWFRGLTVYMTSGTDFQDAYWAFTQAAADLIGTFPDDPRTAAPSSSMFTAADADEVDKALRAVGMDAPGRCGQASALLNSDPPTECGAQNLFFGDDFEGGLSGWTVSNSGPPTAYDWVVTDPGELLPFLHPGRVAYCPDLHTHCTEGDESAVHHLDSPVIDLPALLSFPTLAFTHFMDSQHLWDGGNLKISVDGGPWELIPAPAFYYNPYNRELAPADQGSTNPIAGEQAFNGSGGEWGTSLVHLGGYVSGSEAIQIRFDLGKDECIGTDGWYIDDVRVYDCTAGLDCDNNGVPDDVQTAGGGHPDVIIQHLPGHGDGFFTDADDSAGGVNVCAQQFSLFLPKTVHAIKIWGGYYPANTPAIDDFTVIFHAQDPDTGLPGTTVASETQVSSMGIQTGLAVAGVDEWEITLDLAAPVALSAGTYWVEIFNDTTGDNDDDFFWITSQYTSGLIHAAEAPEAPGVNWSPSGTFDHSIELIAAFVGADCNENRSPDTCDIDDGTSFDDNGNGIPDECEVEIPAVSEWGMVSMALLILAAGTLVFTRRHSPRTR
ncbi:MAG: IPTL-CTERM sorting domain-containing protein [Planctomycetota bacterium]|jgi:Zn-dependent metalloprotease